MQDRLVFQTGDTRRAGARLAARRWLRAAIVLCGVVALTSPAAAQIMILDTPAGDSSEQDPAAQQGFTVPTDESLQTTFGDFQRHVERKAWEKAFSTLSEIPPEKRTGMLARKDGLIVPAQLRIWESIAELPADGREAFRVFYDAAARQAWEPVAAGKGAPSEQIAAAERIFQQWFLTSVGDNAADFLGDAALERGDAEAAERYWRAVLEKHPASDIPEERLLFKRGLALARLGQSGTATSVQRTLTQRFPNAKIRVAGREVSPSAALAEAIAKAPQRSTQESRAALAFRQAPPPETSPAWRTQFVSPKAYQQIEATTRNNYWYRNGMETLVPATASDGERLYCNWFGVCFATDLQTGKLLWRSQKFSELNNHIGNLPHSATDMAGYSLVAGHGIVLSVNMPLERLNYWQEPFRMFCFDAATGNVKWKTLDQGDLQQINFVGQPLIEADRILAIGNSRESAQFVLYSLDPQTGKSQWSAPLGTAKKRMTPRGYEAVPQPVMLRQGRTLFVATQNGALAAFDLDQREVRWLLTYDGPATGQSSRFVYSGMIDDVTRLHTRTAIVEQDGLLYVKEAGSRELVAVDPAGPSILWKRPAEQAAQLVGVDQDAVYLLDTELSSIDRRTRTLRWATRLPIECGGLSAVIGPESVLVLTSRGLFELDRNTGDPRNIFRGVDLKSGGGRLQMIGRQLVAVTTISVTSYGESAADSSGAPAADTSGASAAESQ
ncbi:MAG: PQQ-binding-like beta-propeller repeat protein [Planctomyces sp.]|nr:PQQ-binding-like beta-propeller repeat protein [Planctomyces sp.]